MEALAEIEAGLSCPDKDRRWQAAIAAGELIPDGPESVWQIVQKFGSDTHEDVRAVIATCVLEHLLEHHFVPYFQMLKTEIESGNSLLSDTNGPMT